MPRHAPLDEAKAVCISQLLLCSCIEEMKQVDVNKESKENENETGTTLTYIKL